MIITFTITDPDLKGPRQTKTVDLAVGQEDIEEAAKRTFVSLLQYYYREGKGEHGQIRFLGRSFFYKEL